MQNRLVGIIIVGISILVGFLVWLFNKTLSSIVNESCSHGPTCPMWGSIKFQTNVGLGILIFLLFVGLYLIFFNKSETSIIREIHKETRVINRSPKKIIKKDYSIISNKLSNDEKKIFNLILNSQGSIFQSELVSKTSFSKVKITRILDRLEGKGLVERKRRGMTNIILLKN